MVFESSRDKIFILKFEKENYTPMIIIFFKWNLAELCDVCQFGGSRGQKVVGASPAVPDLLNRLQTRPDVRAMRT